MGWFDSGHTEPAPRGQEISIPSVSKIDAVKRFGVVIHADVPVTITGDPRGRRW